MFAQGARKLWADGRFLMEKYSKKGIVKQFNIGGPMVGICLCGAWIVSVLLESKRDFKKVQSVRAAQMMKPPSEEENLKAIEGANNPNYENIRIPRRGDPGYKTTWDY